VSCQSPDGGLGWARAVAHRAQKLNKHAQAMIERLMSLHLPHVQSARNPRFSC